MVNMNREAFRAEIMAELETELFDELRAIGINIYDAEYKVHKQRSKQVNYNMLEQEQEQKSQAINEANTEADADVRNKVVNQNESKAKSESESKCDSGPKGKCDKGCEDISIYKNKLENTIKIDIDGRPNICR